MKIITKFLIAIALVFLAPNVFGQDRETKHTVKGIILDSATLKPVVGVSLSLKSFKGGSHNSDVSKTDGSFTFYNVSKNSYTANISFLGYQPKKLDLVVDLGSKDTIDMGTILVQKSVITLKEVVVSAKKELITQEADRLVYNLEADVESKSQNIFDVLRKVPLISITADDQIQLKGNTNFKVLFNGKNSSLVVGNPKDVFKVMPANMIEKIEIITIPPAKYDSEGLGGIINIVTLKTKFRGYIGGLNLSSGYMNTSDGGQLSVKLAKLGLSANIGSSYEYPPNTKFENLYSQANNPNYSLRQEGSSELDNNTSFGSLRVSYELDSLNLLSATFSGRVSSNSRKGNQYTLLTDFNSQGSFDLSRSSSSDGKGYGFDFNYEKGFKKNKRQLISISYNLVNGSNDQSLKNIISQNINFPLQDILQNNFANLREQTGQVDYVHPIGKFDISFGLKIINRDNSSAFNSQSKDPILQTFVENPSNSNSFDYTQQIRSVYNSYLFKIKNWGISTGIRYEHTTNNADFISSGSTLHGKYDNLAPTIALSKNLNKVSSLNFGYTQRIQRPNITQLNPFVDKSDPTFYYSGNPDLEPVRNHVISFNYNLFKKGYLGLGLTHSFATNTIQRAVTVISDNLSESRYYNIGRNSATSLNANMNYPLSTKYTLTINGLVSFINISGMVGSREYENDGIQGNAYFYLTRKFKKEFSASINAGFYSPIVILQGTSNSYFYSSLSANKALLERKLMFSASISNPFQKYRISKNQIFSEQLIQEFKSYNYARSFNLSVNYNFGKMQGGPIKRNKKSVINDDSVQKGSEEKGRP